MNNKIVIGCGAASVLGMLFLVAAVWVAVVVGANGQPTDLRAAEPSPEPPAPQAVQDAQAASSQEAVDPGEDFEQMEEFKEEMQKSRQGDETPGHSGGSAPAHRRTTMPGTGEGVTLPSGLTVTVHSYSSPVESDSRFWKPEEGKQFAVLDVEGCAATDSGNEDLYLDPSDFSLQMPDNTRIGWTIPSVADPALTDGDLLPGECVRGLVSFQVPQGQRPSYVRFDQMFSEEVAKWSVD